MFDATYSTLVLSNYAEYQDDNKELRAKGVPAVVWDSSMPDSAEPE
jgi:hypothetical protein